MSASKKYRASDVTNLYKKAYKHSFPWCDYLSERMSDFLKVLWRARCCPPDLVMPSLLCTTSSLAGPNTKIEMHPNANQSPLILYMFAVTVPGGGKTSTFENVVLPGDKVFEAATGHSLVIENYTHAGMQTHQSDTGGYGLISTDEGIRVLAAIHGKQVKHEGERQFLCKSWTGQGDYTILRESKRGYPATSMSLLLYVQPQPLLMELGNFQVDDGLLERINFVISRPELFTSEVITKYAKLMTEHYQNIFSKVMQGVYDYHKDKQVVYKFEEDAQIYYNQVSDLMVTDFNKQFESEDDEPLQISQDDGHMNTSKCVVHIGRLAGSLHCAMEATECILSGNVVSIPRYIPLNTVKIAHKFYSSTLKQKTIFMEAIAEPSDQHTIAMKPVRDLYEKIVKIVFRLPGPFVLPRQVNKHLVRTSADIVRDELMVMTTNGLGTYKARGEERLPKEVFFKIIPSALDEHDDALKNSEMTHSYYERTFKDTSKITGRDQNLMKWHPENDNVMVSFDSVVTSTGDGSNFPTIPLSSQSDASDIVNSQHSSSGSTVISTPPTPDLNILNPPKRRRLASPKLTSIPTTSGLGKGKGLGKKSKPLLKLISNLPESESDSDMQISCGQGSPLSHQELDRTPPISPVFGRVGDLDQLPIHKTVSTNTSLELQLKTTSQKCTISEKSGINSSWSQPRKWMSILKQNAENKSVSISTDTNESNNIHETSTSIDKIPLQTSTKDTNNCSGRVIPASTINIETNGSDINQTQKISRKNVLTANNEQNIPVIPATCPVLRSRSERKMIYTPPQTRSKGSIT